MSDQSRDDQLIRNWDELLQELRVSQTGVQILTGFLLTLPFTQRFEALDGLQRSVYLTVLIGSVVTTCLLVAPVAFHRLLFRRHRREWLVDAANKAARAGLVMLALTTSGVVFLVFDVVINREIAVVAGALTLLFFSVVWIVVPLVSTGQRPRQ